jgi:hypothetical protein
MSGVATALYFFAIKQSEIKNTLNHGAISPKYTIVVSS